MYDHQYYLPPSHVTTRSGRGFHTFGHHNKAMHMAAHHTKSTMKRTIALLAMTALMGVAFAQEYVTPEEKWKFAEVNGHNYHGYVFHKDWKVDVNVENQDGRYTPTDEDIALVEKLVKKKIAYLNRHHENQEGMCPIIDEHMDKYERQYV